MHRDALISLSIEESHSVLATLKGIPPIRVILLSSFPGQLREFNLKGAENKRSNQFLREAIIYW